MASYSKTDFSGAASWQTDTITVVDVTLVTEDFKTQETAEKTDSGSTEEDNNTDDGGEEKSPETKEEAKCENEDDAECEGA